MADLLAYGAATRAVIYAIIVGLLIRHVWRFHRWLAVSQGERFPLLYWCFIAFMSLAACEGAVAAVWPTSATRILLGMASDLAAIYTIGVLWRSNEEAAERWEASPNGIAAIRATLDRVGAASDAIVARGRHD